MVQRYKNILYKKNKIDIYSYTNIKKVLYSKNINIIENFTLYLLI